MNQNDDTNCPREALLRELHTKRSSLQKDLAELDQTIAGIMKFAGGPSNLALRVENDRSAPDKQMPRYQYSQLPALFATMSARWAILHMLDRAVTERASQLLSTIEITRILRANGKTSEAIKFSNNVSATLSDMKSPRGELDLDDGRWKITEKGKSAIQHIRSNRWSVLWNQPINWAPLDFNDESAPDAEAPVGTT